MYPILIATSFHPRMRCIPTFASRSVDWLPVDVAAQCISQLLLSQRNNAKIARGKHKQQQQYREVDEEENTYTVHNIVNPERIPWSSLLSIIQSSMTGGPVEEIPISEWVRRLTSLADQGVTVTDLPGLRLLGFFERMAEEEDGGAADKVFETGRSRELSSALRECGPVCKEWLERTLKVWREDGFLKI
jgi:hypothetical protein